MQGESSAGADLRAVPLPAQQVQQGKAGRGEEPPGRAGGRRPSTLGGRRHMLSPAPPSLPLLQQFGGCIPAGELW